MMMGSYEYDAVSSVSCIDISEHGSKQEDRESLRKGKATIESYREMKKKESERKLEEWIQTKCALTGLLDTTGASILKVNGHKLKLTKPQLFIRLIDVLWTCRWNKCLAYFSHPGGEDCDGGIHAVENSPGLISHYDKQYYVTKCRTAIKQYNKRINHQQSQPKLEFCSFIRVANSLGCELYLTFTACKNGELGTYQAVLDDDCFGDGDVNLVLLRHLEADKIIAIMSLSGAEEEWEKMFGKNWKFSPY